MDLAFSDYSCSFPDFLTNPEYIPEMRHITRILNLELPQGQSAFLRGPRKTGKSTYLKEKFPRSLRYDFLDTDLFLEFSKRSALLREQLLAKDEEVLRYPIILDEVQKVPRILAAS